MDKAAIRREVCQLLDVCRACPFGRTNFIHDRRRQECLSCPIYAGLRKRGNLLDTDGDAEVQRILDKGRKMNPLEVARALELGADPAEVSEALGMNSRSFYRYRERRVRPLQAQREKCGKNSGK